MSKVEIIRQGDLKPLGARAKTKEEKYSREIETSNEILYRALQVITEKAIERATAGKGDAKLLMYLMDRALGRPTEYKEISATAQWREEVKREFDELKELSDADLYAEYQKAIGTGK